MPGIPHAKGALEAIIEQAMKDRAPRLYRSLKAAGSLGAAISGRAEQARESYQTAMSQVITEASKLDGWDAVSAASRGRANAAEVAIAQAVEF